MGTATEFVLQVQLLLAQPSPLEEMLQVQELLPVPVWQQAQELLPVWLQAQELLPVPEQPLLEELLAQGPLPGQELGPLPGQELGLQVQGWELEQQEPLSELPVVLQEAPQPFWSCRQKIEASSQERRLGPLVSPSGLLAWLLTGVVQAGDAANNLWQD